MISIVAVDLKSRMRKHQAAWKLLPLAKHRSDLFSCFITILNIYIYIFFSFKLELHPYAISDTASFTGLSPSLNPQQFTLSSN